MRRVDRAVDGPHRVGAVEVVKGRLNFTIMNMSLSGMAVKDVKVDRLSNDPSVPEAFEWKGGMMARNQWIRYIVKSSSYVCRFCGVCWTLSIGDDGRKRAGKANESRLETKGGESAAMDSA